MKKLSTLFISFLLLSSQALAANQWGSFSGPVEAKWLKDGRNMKILKSIQYTDPSNVVWDVPQNSVVDGASIPQFAWSIIGGPFEGKYRDASVIHDVACNKKDHLWKQVHRAFYTAMLASDVDPIKAKIMYAAVYYFGPRWSLMVKIPRASMSELGSQTYELKTKSGIHNEVIIKSLGQRTTMPQGVFVLGTKDEVHDVVIEVRPQANSLTKSSFSALKNAIEKDNLSIEQIETYVPPVAPK